MEVRSVSSIPVNRPAASPVASAAGNTTPPVTPAEREGAPGGFISPVLRYDQMARVAVLYFRDTDTGETKVQIPAERVVEEYRRNVVRLSTEQGARTDEPGTDDTEKTGDGAAGKAGGTESKRFGSSSVPASPGDGVGLSPTPALSDGYAPPAASGNGAGGGVPVSSGSASGGPPGALLSVTV